MSGPQSASVVPRTADVAYVGRALPVACRRHPGQKLDRAIRGVRAKGSAPRSDAAVPKAVPRHYRFRTSVRRASHRRCPLHYIAKPHGPARYAADRAVTCGSRQDFQSAALPTELPSPSVLAGCPHPAKKKKIKPGSATMEVTRHPQPAGPRHAVRAALSRMHAGTAAKNADRSPWRDGTSAFASRPPTSTATTPAPRRRRGGIVAARSIPSSTRRRRDRWSGPRRCPPPPRRLGRR